MHPYMKTLRPRVKKICNDAGYGVYKTKVRGNNLAIYFLKESETLNARFLKDRIREILDAEGAGFKYAFDGMTDSWSVREGYTNTQGIEPIVTFHSLTYGD